MTKNRDILNYISLLIGFISLGITIIFIEDLPTQIALAVGFIILIIYTPILQNKASTEDNTDSIIKLNNEVKKLNEKINLHERILKLEKEVFKR
jgi:hypothetical protein